MLHCSYSLTDCANPLALVPAAKEHVPVQDDKIPDGKDGGAKDGDGDNMEGE